MKRKSLFVYGLLLIALCAAGYFAWDYFSVKETYMPYSNFYELVEKNQVTTAVIKSDSIEFSCEGKDFKTENPHSPTLEETLLKNGVKVSIEKDSSEIISLIFDIIFYVFFFAVIFFSLTARSPCRPRQCSCGRWQPR